MANAKVKYLLKEHGRFFYQRRVPKSLIPIVRRTKWRAPLGADSDVAIKSCIALAADHDALMDRLKDPEQAQEYITVERHERDHTYWTKIEIEDNQTRAWIEESDLSESERNEALAEIGEGPLIDAVLAEREAAGAWREVATWVTEYERLLALSEAFEKEAARKELFASGWSHPMDKVEFHELLEGVFRRYFGPEVVPPSDPEERDDFDAVKMKLERKIARVAPEKDTISAVAGRYYQFNDLRQTTVRKYRRHIADLVETTGDIPIKQLSGRMLRDHRDSLNKRVSRASLHAAFSPIKGILKFALQEELIENNPMGSVLLQPDKRPVEDIKWLPFSASEMSAIFLAAQNHWGGPLPGLPKKRREALLMLIRVLAHTALRPHEVMSLTSNDVTDEVIHIREGKTPSAIRAIPVHPHIQDFPEWIRSGGMNTFENIETDRVTPLRQNFRKLLLRLEPPIDDDRKALYSLRSTFQNAMERAGVPLTIRQAILGHKEAGTMRHYSDGPEFEEKQKWIFRADPCK